MACIPPVCSNCILRNTYSVNELLTNFATEDEVKQDRLFEQSAFTINFEVSQFCQHKTSFKVRKPVSKASFRVTCGWAFVVFVSLLLSSQQTDQHMIKQIDLWMHRKCKTKCAIQTHCFLPCWTITWSLSGIFLAFNVWRVPYKQDSVSRNIRYFCFYPPGPPSIQVTSLSLKFIYGN